MPHACTPAPSRENTRRYEGRQMGVSTAYPTTRSCSFPSSATATVRRASGLGAAPSGPSSGIGKAAALTELPPRSITTSVARKSFTSRCDTRNVTWLSCTCPCRSKYPTPLR
ncbi:MAG: hypothetical protein U0326_44680 [Polyangiales bacterium]